MNLNVIGGTFGVLALVAVLGLNGCHRTVTPPTLPKASPVSAPAASKAPAALKPAKSAPAPAPAPAPKQRLHRVLPGGKLDGTIDCAQVRNLTEGKTPAQLAALAVKYRVSAAQLAKYKTCLN